ncbi:hypothetical protein V2J09_019312 [Rumex salicifolius]
MTMSSICSRCTFLRPLTQKFKFQPKWASKFINSYSINQIDGYHNHPNKESVFFSLRSCSRATGFHSDVIAESADFGCHRQFAKQDDSSWPERFESDKHPSSIKILSYNVWFREDLEMQERMEEIGDLIHLHSPHIICLQEVTPEIYCIFQNSSWWRLYQYCSVSPKMAYSKPYFCMLLAKLPVESFNHTPFSNTKMGRELCIAEVKVNPDKSLMVATTHLESPCPGPPKWDQMYSKERVAQANESVNLLMEYPNVVFGGDMNWDDKLDGHFPLPKGWVDAWLNLKPNEKGYTYDTKSNKMLSGNRSLQKRLDRFFCNLKDFTISGIEMVGTEEIPGLLYCKEKKSKNGIKKLMLPVFPSDHYGLLVTITKV